MRGNLSEGRNHLEREDSCRVGKHIFVIETKNPLEGPNVTRELGGDPRTTAGGGANRDTSGILQVDG